MCKNSKQCVNVEVSRVFLDTFVFIPNGVTALLLAPKLKRHASAGSAWCHASRATPDFGSPKSSILSTRHPLIVNAVELYITILLRRMWHEELCHGTGDVYTSFP